MSAESPSILRLTDVVFFSESSVGVKSGNAFKLAGLSSAQIRRSAERKFQRRDPYRHVVEAQTLLQSYQMQIQGEWNLTGAWKELLPGLLGELILTEPGTPAVSFTRYTYAARSDSPLPTFGATIALDTGEVYRLKGMGVSGLSLSFPAASIPTFTLDFVVLQMESGATAETEPTTWEHEPIELLNVTPKLVLGGSLAGDATDLLTPCSKAEIQFTRSLRSVQFDSIIGGIGEGTRLSHGIDFDATGTLTAYTGEANAQTLAVGRSEGVFQLEIQTGTDASVIFNVPRGEFLTRDIPTAEDDFDMMQIDFVAKANATDGRVITSTLVFQD